MKSFLALSSKSLAIILLIITFIYSITADTMQQVFNTGIFYLVACIVAYIHMIMNPNRGGVSMMLYFFFCFFIALPALVQIFFDIYPWQSNYTPGELAKGYTVLTIAQLSYFAGESYITNRIKRKVIKSKIRSVDINFYWVSVFSIGGVCILLILFLGPDVLFMTRGEMGGNLTEGLSQQLIYIGRSMSLLALIIMLFLNQHHSFKKNKVLFLTTTIFIGLLFFVLNYPPGLSRFQLLGSVIALSAVFINYFDSRIKFIVSIVSVLFLFFLFPAVKALGYGGGIGNVFGRQITEYLVRVDFDAFKQIADTVIYMEDGSYRLGMNFIGVLFFWVPRAVWPGKPVDSGAIVSTDLGYWYTNVSSPLPAEALISFGYAGVCIIFFLLAIAITKIEIVTLNSNWKYDLKQSAFLYCLSMGFITIILRGALNGVAPMFGNGFLLYLGLRFLHDNFKFQKHF